MDCQYVYVHCLNISPNIAIDYVIVLLHFKSNVNFLKYIQIKDPLDGSIHCIDWEDYPALTYKC